MRTGGEVGMNLLNINSTTNLICPKCKNPNYMVHLLNASNIFQYKCTNCNSYFTFDDLTSRTSTIEKDLVEVVRCEDCKHLSSHADGVPFCKRIKKFVDADWFCADGDRQQKTGKERQI